MDDEDSLNGNENPRIIFVMEDARYISVIGAGESGVATDAAAEEVGRLIATAGAVLVCGGLGGVMEAACRGARAGKGVTIGILPGLDRGAGNPYLDYSICTGIGHARNLAVAASGDAVIAIGGSFGTLSEIGLAAKSGRRVVLLGSWEIGKDGRLPRNLVVASTPEEAVALAME
ncbi:MAG: TIGR00725 family protein [Actinobacteria bacterium]|nr:TIGR00725 family protein [Actinomycetota bacterium]